MANWRLECCNFWLSYTFKRVVSFDFMPQFSYKARRRSGEVVEGLLDVADRSAALIQIERLGLFPVAVDASKAGAVLVAADRPKGPKADWRAMLPPTVR